MPVTEDGARAPDDPLDSRSATPVRGSWATWARLPRKCHASPSKWRCRPAGRFCRAFRGPPSTWRPGRGKTPIAA